MNKSQFQKFIRQEIISIVREELPKIVGPLVKESVAGALANLIAEGIVKGPPAPVKTAPKILTPNIPIKKQKTGRLEDSARRQLIQKLGYGNVEQIGESEHGDLVQNILVETAMDMNGMGASSVLDNIENAEIVDSSVVNAVTRDYSELIRRMETRGKLNG